MAFKKNGVDGPSTCQHKLQGTPNAIETIQVGHPNPLKQINEIILSVNFRLQIYWM